MSRLFSRVVSVASWIGAIAIVLGSASVAVAKPVEYVKICHLYGQGFYYIPGTDTCIKIGGYVRTDHPVQQGTGKVCNDTYFTRGKERCKPNPPSDGSVQYVKTCQVYGAGFYYIPGTDTCLKLAVGWALATALQPSPHYGPFSPWFGKRPTINPGLFWPGFYGGGGLGAMWAAANWATTSLVTLNNADRLVEALKEMRATHVAEEVYFGYMDYLGAPEWVAALEAHLAYYDALMDPGIPGAAGLPGGNNGSDSVTVRAKWSAGLRGRIGYLITPTTLLYATGGVSWLNLKATLNCTAPGVCGTNGITPFSQTNSATKVGWTAGAGIERMLWGQWRGRLEYRYSDYGTFSTNFGAPAGLALAANIDVHIHSLMVGLTYGFGGPR